jgi:hypothetical protein
MTYGQLIVALFVAIFVYGQRNGWQSFTKKETWIALFVLYFGQQLKQEASKIESTIQEEVENDLHKDL